MVTTTELTPSPHLRPYIEKFAFREFDTIRGELQRPLPAMHEFLLSFKLTNSSVVHYKPTAVMDLSKEESMFTGNTSEYYGYLNFKGHLRIFSIQFKPNGFYSLFGIPASLFTNQTIMGHSVINKEIATLQEQLQEAKSVHEMVYYSERFLNYFLQKKKLNDDCHKRIGYVANKIMYSNLSFSMEKLAVDACMSMKTLERNFTEQVGVAPKMFARLVRFNKAIALKMGNEKDNWTSIAHACGYYDQMHLVKEFKLFTGDSPTVFFKHSPPPKENFIRK